MKPKITDMKEAKKNTKTNIILKKNYKKNVNKKLTVKKDLLSIDNINDNNKKIVSLNSTSDNTNIIDNESTDFSDPLALNNDDCHYYIYQKLRIFDPAMTIVQQQINNTSVKVLIFKPNVEQKLIKLDILNPECSLADILEKINIKFDSTMRLSLVEDTKYEINYIIELDFNDEKMIYSHDELNDPTYDTSKYNNALIDRINDLDSSYQNDSSYLTIDKSHNDDYNLQVNPIFNNDIKKYDSPVIKVIEKAKYYDTELAICNHCLYPSINFNHCYYCEKKIECNPKTIPNTLSEEQIKSMKCNINDFYDNWFNNLVKNINNDSIFKQNDNTVKQNGNTVKRNDNIVKQNVNTVKQNNNIVKQNDENKKSILSLNKKTTNKKKKCDTKISSRNWVLLSRVIKIGSYNCVNDDDNNNIVIINKIGFVLSVATLKDKPSIVKIKIKYEDIIKAKFYFNHELNVVFLYTNNDVGLKIRKLLGMKHTTGPVYNPESDDPITNKITLVFDNLSHDVKRTLADQMKEKIKNVVKLEKPAAHNMLVNTSEVNKIMTLQLHSMKTEGLNKVENNDETDKQVPSFSTNSGYPGCIEAIRQAKGKKKSHDVSLEMLFSCLPESVIKQHNTHLNEWWNYCLSVNKDPLETNLSVFISYLETKLDASASRDDLKSIASSVCLIASNQMASQIFSLSFLFSDFAKYSSANNTDSYKTELSCQDDSKISSLNIEIKKQDETQIASVENENVKKSELPELIDISDDQLSNESPSALSNNSTNLLNNNEPTDCKKNIVLQKAIDSPPLLTPLIKKTSTKPPPIFLRKRRRNKQENNIKAPITGTNNDQHIPLIDVSEISPKKQQSTIDNTPLIVPAKPRMNDVVIDDESGSLNKKDLTMPILIPEEQQNEAIQEQQSTLTATNNNQEIDSSTNNVAPSTCTTMPILIPEEQQNEAIQEQQSTLTATNNNQEIDSPTNNVAASTCASKSLVSTSEPSKLQTLSTETLTPVIELPTPSANLSVDDNTQPLSPCKLNASVQECLSEALEQNKAETGGNLQSELLLVDTVQKEQQQQQNHQLPSANIDLPTKTLTPVIKPDVKSPVIPLKLQTLSTETLTPVIESPTQSANLSVDDNTQPLSSCQLNTSVPEFNSIQEEQQQQQNHQLSSVNNTHAIIDSPTKTLTPAIKPATPMKSPVYHSTSPLIPYQSHTSVLERSSQELEQNKIETTDNLQRKLSLDNTVQKKQQQQLPSAIDVPSNDVAPSTCASKSLVSTSEPSKLQALSTETLTPVIKSPIPSANLPVHNNTQPLSSCQLNTSALKCSTKTQQNKVETGGFVRNVLSLAKTVPKTQQRQPSANNNQAIGRPTKTLTSAIKPTAPAKLPVNHNTSLLNTSALDCSSEKLNLYKVTTINNSQNKLSLGNTVRKWPHQQKQQPSANNTQAVIKPSTKTLTPAIKPVTPAKLPANTSLLNTSALEYSSEKLNQNKVESPDSAQKEILLLMNTVINKMQQPLSANNNNKIVLATNNVLSSTCYFKSSGSIRPLQLKLQKILPAIKPPTPSANVSIHHNTLPCSSGGEKQNKVEKIVNPQKKLLLVPTVVQKSSQQPSANKKQAIDVYSNNVVPKTSRVVSSSVPSKLKVTVKKTSDPPSLTPRQTNTSALKPSSEVMKKNNVKKIANLQSEMILSNAASKKQQPQKAQSYLLNKTPVQLVDTNQSSKKSGPLMNLDKSKSKSIPDLSKQSIKSKISSNENIFTENNSNYASLLKNIVDPQTTIVQKQIDGNTVKMLVVMEDGEQRLITFNIPSEECTVNDLLEQAGILFNGATTVSLIKDPIFNINYIVESKAGAIVDSTQTGDVNDELSNYDNVLVDRKYLQDDYDDNNIHATSTVNIEKPIYIDGKLAMCDKCDRASMDFNRCYRCKKKIQNNPETASYICTLAQKKEMMESIDNYYKSLLNNDRTKLNLHTTIMCRTVKIGSYKYTPKDRIIINTSGLILSVPLIEDESNAVKIHVRYQDIGKVLIHFGESVIFFYTNTTSGSKIREILGMQDSKGPYYDPAGKNQTHKRITLLTESLNEESKTILKQLFLMNNLFEEITTEEPTVTLARLPPNGDLNDSSSKNEDTNSNDKNIEESNNVNDELTDNNSKQVTSPVIVEEPKYIDGKLAVCDNCGLTSMDFNRCYWCKGKIPENPTTKPYSGHPPLKRNVMLLNNNYYKSLANNNIKITISPNTICPAPESSYSFIGHNGEDSIDNGNNNKRKHSQLEGTAKDENSNEIFLSKNLSDQLTKKIALEKSCTSSN
ncbi:hypothetical protein HCN44_007347 [Aphidius gifuensis]|uniref:Uncharacterized protein n=1 Tax=Aphidius gifuensis TaxID=684658 RepID=A0A834XLF5_APHGI|nr:hypothetical protein HCN44_007347 [Aphidius gifuensis]